MLLALLACSITAWLYMPVPALSATVPAQDRPAAENGLPWLSATGQRIVDSAGRTVMLRGFNDDALLESTMHPAPLDATDATLMVSSGFDVVRLPIAWSLLEPTEGRIDQGYLDRIAAAVSLLTSHHLYVVLDMHFLGYSPVYGGSGAPAWATVPHVPDPIWGPMPSLGRFLSPAINVSYARFWFTQGLQQDLVAVWADVARRFRNDSGVAGYDLFNEPHAFPTLPIRFDKDQLFPFYAAAIQAIGAADPNHLFFLGNDMAADLPTWVVHIDAPNLVYAPHIYTGSLLPPAFDGNSQPERTHIDELASEASSLPGALWFGEFSIDYTSPRGPGWVAAVLAAFAQHDAGWAWWQWRESSGYGVRSADGRAMNLPLLRALAAPYVMATPSGVSAAAGGATLRLVVAAAHGDAPIEVAWPAFLLGAPLVTSTCDAGSIWDASASRAAIVVTPGASCSVTVSPAA